MDAPAPTAVPPLSGKARWAARLQRLGQLGLTIVLLGIGALWVHELFADPAVRQVGKLFALWVLIPVGALASLALGIGWGLRRASGEKR